MDGSGTAQHSGAPAAPPLPSSQVAVPSNAPDGRLPFMAVFKYFKNTFQLPASTQGTAAPSTKRLSSKRQHCDTEDSARKRSAAEEAEPASLASIPPLLDFLALPDAASPAPESSATVHPVPVVPPDGRELSAADLDRFGLACPISQWRVFGLTDTPGFYFIPSPFSESGQRRWTATALREYPVFPEHKSNIDVMGTVPEGRLWARAVQAKRRTPTRRPGRQKSEHDEFDMYNQLRWVTLGYHYDWTLKKYFEERKSVFPADLARLSSYIAAGLGFHSYRAEAAIVNYYHLNSTISDFSEEDHVSPLISISFGCSAVFLLGGNTRDEQPKAILIRSGDIVVMSQACRLCYHAVPKIIEGSCPDFLSSPSCVYARRSEEGRASAGEETDDSDDDDSDCIREFISQSRLNLNIRQVHP